MNRIGVGALGLLAVVLAFPRPGYASERPNVILIISDDHAWTDYGFMGHPEVATPHIDRLAAGGLTFTRGYVPTALCSPSLATLLTGLYPHQHGITGNDPHDPAVARSWNSKRPELRQPFLEHFLALPQLPRLLRDAGYLTMHTGKFWMGTPAKAGFTHDMGETGRHGGKALAIGRDGMEPIDTFMEGALTAGKPFFVWYAPFLPHTPHNPPERLLERYAELEDRGKAKYLAMITWLDETCGHLMARLEEKGIADQTLIIYLADNGWNQHGKGSPYENGVRTPIIARWPGRIEARLEEDRLASSIDVVPTILAACGVEAPEGLPGIDLLHPRAVEARDTIFLENFAHDMLDAAAPEMSLWTRCCIRDQWKFTRWQEKRPKVKPFRDGARKKDPSTAIELFDLIRDPHETTDGLAAHPGIVEELDRALDAWWDPDAK